VAAVDDPEPAPRVIAFGSCARQDRPQPIWSSVLAAEPDLFIFLGDNVYADTGRMEIMQAAYDALGAQPGFQQLKASVPILATWDDHDYGADDGGAEYRMKAESAELFLDFFEVPADSPRRAHPGIYGAHEYGPLEHRVQVLLLDLRTFRGPLLPADPDVRVTWGPYRPHEDDSETLLGEAQWTWLAEQLRRPAELRILASSTQLIGDEHGWETWGNFPHERERLYKLIRSLDADGLLIISGDRRHGELSVFEPEGLYPLFELTSSSLNASTQSWRLPPETNSHRLGIMTHGDNFGLITIDWDQPDPELSLQIRDVDGRIRIQQRVALSRLAPDRLVQAVPGGGEPVVAATQPR
jgi:alkaline phosphatase D